LGPAAPALAQQPVVLRIDQVDASAFSQVSLLVTVRNGYGGPIPNLEPANFDVSEDRTLEPRPVTAVEPLVNPQAQVAVLLAIDVSGSMRGAKLRDAQEAARRFLDGLGPEDSVALLAFSGSIDLEGSRPDREREFGPDKAPLVQVIAGLQAGGATPLYDTAAKAVRWAAAQPAGNRAVLLFTDGMEERAQDGSGGSRIANDDTAIREANKAGIPVFTIGLGDDADEGYLRRLALETGGVYQHAEDSTELALLFRNVSDLLKQQYRITYTSGLPADGETHAVLAAVRVGEATAFDEAALGPLPLAPDPMPQPTEAPPTPTALPATPTAQPEPAARVVEPPQSSDAAEPPATEAQSGEVGPLGIAPVGWLLIAAGVLAVGSLGVFALGSMGVIALGRHRRTEPSGAYRCLRCGAPLPAKNARCPSCGAGQSYKEGM
jgi:VWFA-related protein